MRVLKFGGAALADGKSVQRAVQIVRRHGGERPTVVVSAHAGVTAWLERAAASQEAGRRVWDFLRVRHRTLLSQLNLSDELLARELRAMHGVLEGLDEGAPSTPRLRDHILSFGERLSARVFAAALRLGGLSATPIDAFDLGIRSAEGRLDPPALAATRVRAALRKVPGIPVVTGFLALDMEGHLTTLGPNGSDLTAAWFGAALDAEEIDLWKCIPGLLTADPRMVTGATLLPHLDWDVAEELARHGTSALHPAAVQPAHRAGIPLCLRDVTDPEGPGTTIGSRPAQHGAGPIALAHRERVVHLRYPAARYDTLLSSLDEAGIEPYHGWIERSCAGAPCAEFLLDDDARCAAWDASVHGDDVRRDDLATIAVVGRGLRGDARPELVHALDAARAVGAREVGEGSSRVLLVERARLAETLEELHQQLFSENQRAAPAGRDRSA